MSERSESFGIFRNFRNLPKLSESSETSEIMPWEFSQTSSQTQKYIHAPEFTSSFSSLSFPPECRRDDEVSRNLHQQPPTSAAGSAATLPARPGEGPWVPGSCPAPTPPHDEGPERGHGTWRGAWGRCPSATGRPPWPSPTRGWPSPTRPPAHPTVTLLEWRLT